MRKLDLPNWTFQQAIAASVAGVGAEATRHRYTQALQDAPQIEQAYSALALAASLFGLPRVAGNGDPIIHNGLTKADLTALYSSYFVPETKQARHIYDDIKVGANGKCPLCGGIGHVRNLDHYLPKANFPLYSILPRNLIPCCRDCNFDKSNTFANAAADQPINPYFDDAMFFNERWVHARVVPGDPPIMEFFVDTPANWDVTSCARVRAHFTQYGLAEKYFTEAGADIAETIHTRRTTMANSSSEDFSAYLLEKSETLAFPINHWRRVMFRALSHDQWFCSNNF